MDKETGLQGSGVFDELLGDSPLVFRICLGFAANPDEAEELCQEIYLKAWSDFNSLRKRDSAKPFIQEELDAAWRLSPEEARKARLNARIAARVSRPRKPRARLLRAVPVLAAALLAVAGAIIVRQALHPPKSGTGFQGGISRYLQSGSGVQVWSAELERELRPAVKPGAMKYRVPRSNGFLEPAFLPPLFSGGIIASLGLNRA